MQGSIGCMVVVTVCFQWLQAFISCRVLPDAWFQWLKSFSSCRVAVAACRVLLVTGFHWRQGFTAYRVPLALGVYTGNNVLLAALFQWMPGSSGFSTGCEGCLALVKKQCG